MWEERSDFVDEKGLICLKELEDRHFSKLKYLPYT